MRYISRGRSTPFDFPTGNQVMGIGRIDVYERDGVYQFYVDMFMPVGTGDLMALAKPRSRSCLQKAFSTKPGSNPSRFHHASSAL